MTLAEDWNRSLFLFSILIQNNKTKLPDSDTIIQSLEILAFSHWMKKGKVYKMEIWSYEEDMFYVQVEVTFYKWSTVFCFLIC